MTLDKDTVNYILEHIRKRISPELDSSKFYGYNKETDEYGLYYNGQGKPKQDDWVLAELYMSIKRNYEYHADLGLSFDMDPLEEE